MSKLKKLMILAAIAALLIGAVPALHADVKGQGFAVVCLDPGHGGEDSGASYYGVMEKDPNLDIALRTRPILQSMGYMVVMTRETDATVSLQRRCDIANAWSSNIFVSIHNNAYTTASEGTETYCYYSSTEGRRLATFIHTEVVKRIRRPDRGVKEAGFYVLKNTDMPSALLEGAFISNPEEARMLQDPAFRQKIAEGVAAGINLYLAEMTQFNEYLLLQNPDTERTAELEIRYMRGDGVEQVYPESVPPHTRRTINVNEKVVNSDVSSLVRSTNGVPVVAERALYFNFEPGRGGHCAPGVTAPADEWYLAEGSTNWGFRTYILVQNPSGADNSVTIQFMRDDGYNAQRTFPLAPHSRFSLDCSAMEGFEKADFSAKLVSQSGIVVERALYFRNVAGKSGGHDSPGVTTPSTRWYLAEGYTGAGFDTYLLMQNPNDQPTDARVTYMIPEGADVTGVYRIEPYSRRSVHVDEVPGLESKDVSFLIESDIPVVAERSMYFNYNGITEGTNSSATDSPSTTWYLPEGYTGSGFDTYILLSNPGDQDTGATLNFMREDSVKQEYGLIVPAHSRRTVRVNDVQGMNGVSFATMVSSNLPVVVERAKYYRFGPKSGGDCAMGSKQPSLEWYFAEGCTRTR